MKIGIIAAMPEELERLLPALSQRYDDVLPAFTLHIGTLENHAVILAQSGVSKVNVAALTQMLISKGVTAIIMTGVAGAADPTLNVGDVVISTDAVQHDVDVSALGYEPGHIPGEPLRWPAHPTLAELAFAVATDHTDTAHTNTAHTAATANPTKTVQGTIATGDQFVADDAKRRWIYETFGAACIEMEGASVAQVCHRWNVPFVIIRSISDAANASANADFRAFAAEAATRAAHVVTGVLQQLNVASLAASAQDS